MSYKLIARRTNLDPDKIARIFEDVGGYYVCAEQLDYLDTRGTAYRSPAAARRAAVELGYTHAVGSGVYNKGIRQLPSSR